MIRKSLLVLAVLGAAMFVNSGTQAEAGGCYRGGYGGYGGYYRGGPSYYRSARYYGPGPGYYAPPRRSAFYGPPAYYRGGSGVTLSFGF